MYVPYHMGYRYHTTGTIPYPTILMQYAVHTFAGTLTLLGLCFGNLRKMMVARACVVTASHITTIIVLRTSLS
jgi:hypothetical protein